MRPKNLSRRREYRILSEASRRHAKHDERVVLYSNNIIFREALLSNNPSTAGRSPSRSPWEAALCPEFGAKCEKKLPNLERSGRLPAEGAGAEGD